MIQNGRKPTVKDVARRAGVSHTTVSMALRGSSRVETKRAEEIREIALEMDYQPRVAAQLLRGKRTGQVGLLFMGDATVVEHGSIGLVIGNFIKTCEQDDIRYHIEFLDPVTSKNSAPHQFTGGLVDGALLAGWVDPVCVKWLEEHPQYPWVSVDEPADYSVVTAADEGVYQAFRHLAALGHRKVAYGGGPEAYLTHRLADEGMKRAVRDFRLTLCGSFAMPDGPRSEQMKLGVAWAEQVLAHEPRPTAVVCRTPIARAIIYVAMQRGLSVPGDLSVIGYGNSADAEKACPVLTSIEPDEAAVVRQALTMLKRRMEGRKIDQPKLSIPPRLVFRDTVAAPKETMTGIG